MKYFLFLLSLLHCSSQQSSSKGSFVLEFHFWYMHSKFSELLSRLDLSQGNKLLCCLVLQYGTKTKFTLLHHRDLLSKGVAGSTKKERNVPCSSSNTRTFSKLSHSSSLCLCDICHVLACFIYATHTSRHLHCLHSHHITLKWNIAVICTDSTDISSSVQA